nr:hypothetical protein [Tanacetum cinerariifolium]
DRGLDVCVDLTGSSPLTHTGMIGFVSGRAVIDVAQRKCVKYDTKCAAIGYGFLLFSFSSLGELEEGVITLLKRIQKFSMTQDVEARAAVHIFNRIEKAGMHLGRLKKEGVQVSKRCPMAALRREAWPSRYETDQGVGSRRDVS